MVLSDSRLVSSNHLHALFFFIKFLVFSLKKKSHLVILSFIYADIHIQTPTNVNHWNTCLQTKNIGLGWDSKPQSSRHLSGLSCWPIHVKYIAANPASNTTSWLVSVVECGTQRSRFVSSNHLSADFFVFFVFIKFLVFSLKKKSHSVILSFIHSFIHLFRQTYIQADTHIHTLTNIHVGFHLRSQTPIGLPKS